MKQKTQIFKVFEENSTNCRTYLLPDFYSLDDIMNILDKICYNKTIKEKLNGGRSIEESIGYDYMCTLNNSFTLSDKAGAPFSFLMLLSAK